MAKAEKDPKRKKELLEIARVCVQVLEKPARTFREALQSFYFYQTCIFMEQNAASYNPGCMDQYMCSFYKADLEAGRITPEAAGLPSSRPDTPCFRTSASAASTSAAWAR